MGNTPKVYTRNIEPEMAGELETRIKLAPEMLAAEQQYSPQYAALELQNLQQAMTGTPATATSAAVPGLMDIYSQVMPQMDRLGQASTTSQRQADIGDVATLGPQAATAFRSVAEAASPGLTGISDTLNRQILDELNLGATLDPSLRREVQQGVRSGQAARGMGYGSSDAYEESLFTGLQAEQLRRTRQNQAMQLLGLQRAQQLDPFMAILGRPSATMGYSQQSAGLGAGLAQSAGPTLFPTTVTGENVYDYNANAKNAGAIAGANNRASLYSAAISSVGSIIGGAL